MVVRVAPDLDDSQLRWNARYLVGTAKPVQAIGSREDGNAPNRKNQSGHAIDTEFAGVGTRLVPPR